VWAIKTEITDPKMKQQMEQAQKTMSDPKKIKEMEDQMNSPQFKQMMEQNPQMKAQMEKTLEMMKSGGGMESMMPKKITIKIKDQKSLTTMEGGAMADNEVLYLKSKGQTINLDRKRKTYSISKEQIESVVDEHSPEVKVTKTMEKVKVLGYTCTKYFVESTIEGKATKQDMWATTEIKDIDFKSITSQSGSKQVALFYKEIEGVVLKMDMKTPEMHMTMEATEIKRGTLPKNDFIVPSDFKEVESPY
jgi:hypothetical protein